MTEIAPGSPAAGVGLRAGDVIVAFAEKTISTPQELQMVVEQTPIGHQQTIVIVRDGKRMELKVSPVEGPGEGKGEVESQNKSSELGSRLEKLGIEAQDLTPELARQLQTKAEHGVVVTDVQSGSPADRVGLGAARSSWQATASRSIPSKTWPRRWTQSPWVKASCCWCIPRRAAVSSWSAARGPNSVLGRRSETEKASKRTTSGAPQCNP